jgi:hypothetical protein
MEAKVLCFVNLNQKLTNEANLAQEPEAKVNYAQKLATKTIEVENLIAQTSQVFHIANMLLSPCLLAHKENKRDRIISRLLEVSCCYIRTILGHPTSKSYAK